MAQIIYHPKNDKNFKKNYLLKTKKQSLHIYILFGVLGLSLALNAYLLLN